MIPLGDLLASLQKDFTSLAKLIRAIDPPIICGNGDVTIRGHYLPFSGAKPRIGELLDHISSYICNFALNRSEIEAVHSKVQSASDQEKMLAYVQLRDTAAELFIKAQKSTNRNGECGELLLYLLTEWILEAPQLLAKMSFKTSSSMPVHSSDGIHIKYDAISDSLIFFWGEAKVHKKIGDALSDAVESIAGSLKYDKLKQDINLVRRFIGTTGLTAAAQAKVVDYLDPLSDNYGKKIDASTCLIGFDFQAFASLKDVSASQIEAAFIVALQNELTDATKRLEGLLKKFGISHHRMEVFFLPLESVDELRKDWQKKIGWAP